MIHWTKVLYPKYIKNSHDSTPGRQTIWLKCGQRTWTDTSPRRTCRGLIDIWEKCSILLVIREMQIKNTKRNNFTPVRMATINKSTNNKCWQECGEKGTLLHFGECRLVLPLWKTVWNFLKKLQMELPYDPVIHCWDCTLGILKHQLKRTYAPQSSWQHNLQ